MTLSTAAPSSALPLPPSPPPGHFIPWKATTSTTYALGLTYADHIRETGEKPGQPVVFVKRSTPTPTDAALVTTPSAQALRDLLLPRRQRIRAALRGALGNPRFLQAGDVVRVSAGWLGSFECTISTRKE